MSEAPHHKNFIGTHTDLAVTCHKMLSSMELVRGRFDVLNDAFDVLLGITSAFNWHDILAQGV